MNLPTPTPEMFRDARYQAIWNTIRDWAIGVPDAPEPLPATTAHARAIFEAINHEPPYRPYKVWERFTVDRIRLAVNKLVQQYQKDNPGRPTKVHFTYLDKLTIDQEKPLIASFMRETPNDGKEHFNGLEVVDWNADELKVE